MLLRGLLACKMACNVHAAGISGGVLVKLLSPEQLQGPTTDTACQMSWCCWQWRLNCCAIRHTILTFPNDHSTKKMLLLTFVIRQYAAVATTKQLGVL
jgi:hypothetical protein